MNKKRIIAVLLVLLITGIIISLYSTFALNEENNNLEKSIADYNLTYSIKESSKTKITVGGNETKYVDIVISNPYQATVKYGIYYYLENVDAISSKTIIELAEESTDALEDIITTKQTKNVSIKITNNETFPISFELGALVGFENGNIEDLVQSGETLIK